MFDNRFYLNCPYAEKDECKALEVAGIVTPRNSVCLMTLIRMRSVIGGLNKHISHSSQ